jgi:hypothetical protein
MLNIFLRTANFAETLLYDPPTLQKSLLVLEPFLWNPFTMFSYIYVLNIC